MQPSWNFGKAVYSDVVGIAYFASVCAGKSGTSTFFVRDLDQNSRSSLRGWGLHYALRINPCKKLTEEHLLGAVCMGTPAIDPSFFSVRPASTKGQRMHTEHSEEGD